MIVTTTVARTNEHLGTAFGIFQVSSRRERGGGGGEGARDPLFSPFFLFGKRSAIVEGIALDRERREDLSSCAVIITEKLSGVNREIVEGTIIRGWVGWLLLSSRGVNFICHVGSKEILRTEN